jgi:hypothetical protein
MVSIQQDGAWVRGPLLWAACSRSSDEFGGDLVVESYSWSRRGPSQTCQVCRCKYSDCAERC